MLIFDSPLLVDRFSISLRWLALLGLSASLITQESFSLPLTITFLAVALWNFALTVLTIFNQPLSSIRVLNVAVDLLTANLLFYLSGTMFGSLGWAGLLPLFSAALYFDTPGFIGVTLLSAFSLGVQAFVFATPASAVVYSGTVLLLYMAVGFLVSYLRRRMVAVIDQAQRERQEMRQEAERIEDERRRAIFDLISALSATLNYQRVLDAALDLSTTALATSTTPAEHMVSAVLLFTDGEKEETRLEVGSARRFTSADKHVGLPGKGGLIGRSIDAGLPRLTWNISKDPELGRFVSLRSCQTAYSVPLRDGLDTYGVLLFAHPEEDYFTPERREILEIVGNQAMIAMLNARLYRDLELEKERMMEIQEDAQKKLARDLHGGPTQSVAALAMRANFARRLMERDAKAAVEELFKIEDLARRTTKELRHMLFTLRPLVLESQGLIAALESMAENMQETFNQNVIIEADPEIIPKLEMNKQTVVFTIAEEAANNARKHAQAAHIWVRLKEVESDIALLEVIDDGRGFNLSDVNASYESRGSLGMLNMRERAKLVNGVFRIDTKDGQGTRIQVVIPLNEEASDRLRRRL